MHNEGIQDIYALLDECRLKEALIQLQGLCSNTNNWALRNKVEETLTAYTYMMQYAEQGMHDPNRQEFYQKTRRKAYELTDLTDITLSSHKKNGTFFDRYRTYALHPTKSYAELQLQLETYTEDMGTAPLLYPNKKQLKTETEKIVQAHETASVELFNKTWTTVNWSATEAKEAKSLLTSVLVPSSDLALMVSAATLSLLRIIDIRKIDFLMDAYNHENQEVSQRAIVGIVLILLNKSERLMLYPDFKARLSLLAEENNFRKNLQMIQTQLLLTRETEKIDKKMQEEIIPEMMKNAKKLNDPKFMLDDPEDLESNPEWGEWMDQSGMSDKIRMMSEWQMEGADVYMSSFSQLKHYPFFHEIAHWFYPFDKHQPALASLNEDFEGTSFSPLKLITGSDFFCNSDKYSFCFALLTMPPYIKEQSIASMQEQIEMNEEKKERLMTMMNRQTDTKGISRQYLQDLYRFFKLWKQQREETDIFKHVIEFWKVPALDPMVFQEEAFIKETGDLLFQKEHLYLALEVYGKLTASETDITEVWQKTGFIHQKLKAYPEAIAHYSRADLLQPDNVWTNLHLAQCYWGLRDMDKALEYYRKVEAVQPENLKVSLKIGQCLAHQEKYEEAINCLYKVEYLDPKPDNARRTIAWCLFVTGRYEEALKSYNRLLEGPSPLAQDWMNAAHVHLALQHIPQAKEHYLKAKSFEKDHTSFLKKFNQDKEVLIAQGLSEVDIQIVLDLLV